MSTAILLGLAWKSLIVAALTLALLRAVRGRSAGERSMVAHAGLAALLMLPAASLLLPTWAPLPATAVAKATAPAASLAAATASTGGSVVDPAPATTSVPVVEDTAGSTPFMLSRVTGLAPFLYAVPLALLFGMMLLAVVRLFAMRGRAEILIEGSWLSALAGAQRRMGFKHGTALLVSDELRSPISWGVLRPTIVLSPQAVEAVGEAEAIIAHELAHVARLDWAKLLAARLACALFWFNPLVWMLARESHQLREEAADDAVLMADIDGPEYATLLVGAARHDNQGALLAAHGVAPGRGSLKRRITRVLDASLKRGPASASWMLMSLVLLAAITAPLAAFSATPRAETAKEHRAVAIASRESAVTAAQSASAARIAAVTQEAVATHDAAAATAKQKGLTADQLVSMRAVGVTADDVAEMRNHDGSIDADDLIAAKASGVDASYIRKMRGIFPDADVGDLIGARSVGVDAAYAREMRGWFPRIDLDDLTGMRAVGVDGAFIREMRQAGAALRDPDDAIALRAVGGPRVPYVAKVSKRGKEASVRIGPGGNVLEARGADGSVARIEMPQVPEPPASPEH